MKKITKLSIIIAALSIFAFMSCKSGKLQSDNPLFANKWVLSELNGTPVQTSGTDKDASISFSLSDMRVTGTGGCNRFSGTFTAKGDELSLGPLASTKMMCPDQKFEDAFFAAMAKVKNFEIADKVLSLKDGKNTVAKFDPR